MTSQRAVFSERSGKWRRHLASDFEIDLKKIPVRQETIEICEFFGLNPYELISGGSMLMAAEDGNQLVHELEKAGIPAAVIRKSNGRK